MKYVSEVLMTECVVKAFCDVDTFMMLTKNPTMLRVGMAGTRHPQTSKQKIIIIMKY
jgi:hypothetical protein